MKIVLDIGGTKTRIARSDDGKTLAHTEVMRTEQNYHEAMGLMYEKITAISENKKIEAIGVGVPGILNPEKTFVLQAANLHPWENKSLAVDLQLKFRCPVKLENDGLLGALAEAMFGSGKDFDSVTYITIGTGIGGGYVVNKKFSDQNTDFYPGHYVLDPNGPICKGDGQSGHWEAYLRTDQFSHSLPQGIAETLKRWPGDVVVLGGGVTLHANWDLEKVRNEVSRLLNAPAPQIKISAFSDDSGLYGALALI